jgi:hypothetical protein
MSAFGCVAVGGIVFLHSLGHKQPLTARPFVAVDAAQNSHILRLNQRRDKNGNVKEI